MIILYLLKIFNIQFAIHTKPNFKRFSRIHTHHTVAESEEFWQATGQSNLADRMEDRSAGQSAVVRVRKLPNFGSFCCGQPFVYANNSLIVQWPARIFHFYSYCASSRLLSI